MPIENFKEIQDYFTANKENDEVKNYVGGFVTPDRVENFLNSEDGKKVLQPKLDSYFNKGLETWKGNNLQKLVDEQYKKKHPDADPKDTKIAELEQKFEQMQKDALRKDLTNKALKLAQDKKLPTEIIDHFIGQTEEETTNNLTALEQVFSKHVETVVAERLKGGYKPPKDNTTLTAEEQAKAEIEKYFKIK